MLALNRHTTISLILLLLILITILIRHSNQPHQAMSFFVGGSIQLGGEDATILTSLRQLSQHRAPQQLTAQDLNSYLPENNLYVPNTQLLLSRHEITNQQYRGFLAIINRYPSLKQQYRHPNAPQDLRYHPATLQDVKYSGHDQPVININWYQADSFCRLIGMRLPSSAEFEVALHHELQLHQSSPMQVSSSGSNETTIKSNGIFPSKVGGDSHPQARFHDLIGNAIEWVQPLNDKHFLMGYSFKHSDQKPLIPTYHAYRRHFATAISNHNDYGFRCAYPLSNSEWYRLQNSPTTVNQTNNGCWSSKQLTSVIKTFSQANIKLRSHLNGHEDKYKEIPIAENLLQRLWPMQMCLLPYTPHQLGPPAHLTSLSLLRQQPLTFSQLILGAEPKRSQISSFWLDQQEVTVAELQDFYALPQIAQHLHHHPEIPAGLAAQKPLNWDLQQQNPNRSVVGVNWYQAYAYCNWQNKRLPFAEEWEAALKGKDQRLYAWGNDIQSGNESNVDITPDQLQNMSKTVSEWTATFVLGSDSAIVKGGSERFDWRIFGRAYSQLKIARHSQSPYIGFRCASSD